MWRLPFDLNFPRSFRLTASPNAFIVDVVPRDNSNILNWNFNFRRGCNDREEEELQSLLQVMNSFSPNSSIPDSRVWVSDSSSFSCKSFFDTLVDDAATPNFSTLQFYLEIFRPYRIKVFAWLVFHGKINTSDFIQRRNPQVALFPSWCILCKKESESLDHLMFHCEVATVLWQKLLKQGFSGCFMHTVQL